MAYNIILQAMSTLRLKRTEEGTFYIEKNMFITDENKEAKIYYGQLEPVTMMLLNKNIVPNMILSLCTDKTMNSECEFLLEDIGKTMNKSAYQFYKDRIEEILPENADTEFKTVMINEENINSGIIGAAKIILSKKRELEEQNRRDKEIKLWVNTQGGFRDISLVLNAIINLLDAYKIKIANIYSMPFSGNNEPIPIVSQRQNYQIFDFVVGMKEFLNYGRADTLEQYYRNMENANSNKGKRQSQEEHIVSIMKKVADAIQMCDPRGFDDGLKSLRKYINSYKESGEQFFDIFVEKVKEDYGILLTEYYSTIDVVEWFRKKEFYQQALTYIEAYVPNELVNKGIIKWSYDKLEIYELKKVRKQTYIEDANYLLFAFVNAKTKDSDKMNKAYEENIENRQFEAKEGGKFVEVRLTSPNARTGQREKKYLFDFIKRYYVLKEERNKFNHMSVKDKRQTKEQLSAMITEFEKLGRHLYKLYQ